MTLTAPPWMAHTSPRDWLLDGRRCPPDVWDDLDWQAAYVDAGPSPAGNPGPYWHVPRIGGDDPGVWHRLYPKLPARWWPVMAQAMREMAREHPRYQRKVPA